MGLHIRSLTKEDRQGWEPLWRAYLAFYETELPAETFDTTFARLTSGDGGEFRALVAVKDGVLVGLAHYLFHRTCWDIANTCYLQDLFADPSVRGQGVGRALIEATYRAADAEGACSVYWLTQEFNHTARRLYDRVATKTPFIEYNRS